MTEQQETQNTFILDVAISPDGLEAYGIISPPADPSIVTVDDVLRQLGAAGVSEGIDEAAIRQMVQDQLWDKRVTLARGVKAHSPAAGRVEVQVEGPFPARVELHQVVGRIVPPEDGKPGRTVTGKIQDPPKPEPYVFKDRPGLITHPEHKDQIVAAETGYLHLVGDKLDRVDPLWRLEISADEMECRATVTRPPREGLVSVQDISAALEGDGITHGVEAAAIAEIFTHELFGQPVVVARGTPPVPGENGQINFLFNLDSKPVKDKRGKVDYKAVKVRNVRMGDPLLRVVEPTKGEPGMTIRGKTVTAVDGKPQLPKLGANVTVSKNDPLLYCAAIDGRVVKKSKDLIAVESVFEVQDVDYETGNIDFVGSVMVKGDVKAGFSVRADGDVVVIGIIEDSQVWAAGSVQGSGFIGTGKGKINAEGDVALNFCENQHILCKGNVIVREALLHSRVECKGFVEVIESKGAIIGGTITAVKGVKALRIGNEYEIKAHIIVGMDADILRNIKEIDRALSSNEENERKLKQGIEILAKMELLKPLTPAKAEVKKQLQQTLSKLQEEADSLPQQRNELLQKIEEFRDATVEVQKEIYPGNAITIMTSHLKITEAIQGVRYFYKDGAVIAEPLSV